MKFLVEHMKGVAGVDERVIEEEIVEAENGLDAIRAVAGNLEGWEEEVDDGTGICSIKDPEATNESGKYCHYWMSEKIDELF